MSKSTEEQFRSHPGFDAPTCPLRSVVSPKPYATSAGGYRCEWTGGHCLPGFTCDERRAISARLEASEPEQ